MIALVWSLLERNKTLLDKIETLEKALRKTQGFLRSVRKEKDKIEEEWEEETAEFNRGWELADKGQVPSKDDSSLIWDGFRSRKYSDLLKEIEGLKVLLSESILSEDSEKEKDLTISDLTARVKSLSYEVECSRSLSAQQVEEIERLRSMSDEWYDNLSKMDGSLRSKENELALAMVRAGSLEKTIESYRNVVLLGPKARLLLRNLVYEIEARNMDVADLASLLRIEISVAKTLWDILKGNDK